MDTTTVGPKWLQSLLGRRGGFILERAGPDCFLSGPAVTDADLSAVEHLSGLQGLDLTGTQVADAGLERLKGLKGLQWLYLAFTQVTDAGLERLKGLKGLQELNLYGTQVTDAGLESLERALPNCVIDH